MKSTLYLTGYKALSQILFHIIFVNTLDKENTYFPLRGDSIERQILRDLSEKHRGQSQ